MLSLLSNGFTQKFPICFVFFKKWIGFCLINAYSVSHIFFLVKADFFADWIADSVVETEHLSNNIEVALRKQAREKLIVSWRKRGKFKFLLLNDNVYYSNKSIYNIELKIRTLVKLIFRNLEGNNWAFFSVHSYFGYEYLSEIAVYTEFRLG